MLFLLNLTCCSFTFGIPFEELLYVPFVSMIEDKASNVEKISDVIPVLCFDAPYNLHVNKDNVTRVYSWYQIYKHFLDLEKENNSK